MLIKVGEMIDLFVLDKMTSSCRHWIKIGTTMQNCLDLFLNKLHVKANILIAYTGIF